MNGERADEMTVFVRAVELGGFSAAARALSLTPSAVSKSISRLEDRLGVRLLNRTTRSLTTTPEGETFLERSRRIRRPPGGRRLALEESHQPGRRDPRRLDGPALTRRSTFPAR